jgi:hypothetical protein
MSFIIRNEDNDLKYINTNDDQARMLSYYLANPALLFYTIEPQGDGTFLLVPQRIQPGSEVTEEVIVSATFEDDV